MPSSSAARPAQTTRRQRGRTRWPRFSMVMVPALALIGLLVTATATAAIPVELTTATSHPLKLGIDSFSAGSTVPSTGPYQTPDGQRRTVLIFHIRDLNLRGLCLSQRMATPAGTYTLRITVPGLTANQLTVAVDNISALDLLGQELNIGALSSLPILNTTPLSPPDGSGFLDAKIGNALAAVSLTIRYFTAINLNFAGLRLVSGPSIPECF